MVEEILNIVCYLKKIDYFVWITLNIIVMGMKSCKQSHLTLYAMGQIWCLNIEEIEEMNMIIRTQKDETVWKFLSLNF